MNLRQVEIFHVIMTTGSISAAAKILNVSQPAISMSIKQAEDRLGYLLFNRVGKRLEPTGQARILYEHTEDIIKSVNRLERLSKNIGTSFETSIKVGISPALSFSILPKALKKFLHQNKGVSVGIMPISYNDAYDLLIQRTIDVAVVFNPEHKGIIKPQTLGTGHFVCVANHNRFKEKINLTLADITGEDFINIADSGPLGKIIEECIISQNIKINSRISVQTYHSAVSMVIHGLGTTVVDCFTAESRLGVDLDKIRLIDLPTFKIGALQIQNTQNTEICNHFLTCFASCIA